MQNPQKEMREYLEQLIENYIYINSLYAQLEIINKWCAPDKIKTLDRSAYFFKLISYSFYRTIIVELSKILHKKEDKSLPDWLEKASLHAKAIKPMRCIRFEDGNIKRVVIPKAEYQKMVLKQIALLSNIQEEIDYIVSLRDKVFAHSDANYFGKLKLKKAFEDYPIDNNKLSNVIKVLAVILKEQYLHIFNRDIIQVKNENDNDLELLLKSARAFKRLSKDTKTITEKNLELRIYTTNKYEGRE